MKEGDTFTHMFDRVGSFKVQCQINKKIQCQIEVIENDKKFPLLSESKDAFIQEINVEKSG